MVKALLDGKVDAFGMGGTDLFLRAAGHDYPRGLVGVAEMLLDGRGVAVADFNGDGLDDGEEMTLEEIGTLMGITRERVRQIESKALAKLQHPHMPRVTDHFDIRFTF